MEKITSHCIPSRNQNKSAYRKKPGHALIAFPGGISSSFSRDKKRIATAAPETDSTPACWHWSETRAAVDPS